MTGLSGRVSTRARAPSPRPICVNHTPLGQGAQMSLEAPEVVRSRRGGPVGVYLAVVSFFDSVTVPPRPERQGSFAQPEWAGPPRGVIPAYSSQRAILVRTDKVILTVGRFACYPNGIQFSLAVRFDAASDDFDGPPWELHHPRHADPSDDRFLRLGVLLADGSKWVNFDPRRHFRDTPPPPPVVWSMGGGGGEGRWEMDQWLWPLPPEGPLTFFAAWPAHGIAETSAEIDGSELRQRAAQAEVVWGS